MFSKFLRFGGLGRSAVLTREEVELIALIRLHPSEAMQGQDLAVALLLTARGLLRSAGGRRFVVTEKAIIAIKDHRR